MKYAVAIHQAVTDSIYYLKLVPISGRLEFTAGQYVEFILSEKELTPFSIANAPNELGHLEFYIRYDISDSLLTRLFAQIDTGELTLKGPQGDCVYQRELPASTLCLAGGVGITQVKSIIEQMILDAHQAPVHLYWGIRKQEDNFLVDELKQWQRQLPCFTYDVILSKDMDLSKRIVSDFPDLSRHCVYSCGPWAMTDNALALFLQYQLKRAQMFSDRFAFL